MTHRRFAPYAGAALVLISLLFWTLKAQQATVTVASITVGQGRMGAVKVSLQGMPSPGLSNFQGRLSYDPKVATAQNVLGLNGYTIAAFQIDNALGEVRFIGFKITEPLLTQGEFMQFDLLATGTAGQKTTLTLTFTVNGFNTPTAYVAPTIINGQLSVTAAAELKADFSWEPAEPQAGQEVKFLDKSSGGAQITSWSWDFGDNTTSTLQTPSHKYKTAGTYTVKLTVKDSQGATSTASKQITVVAPGQLPPVSVHVFPNPARLSATFRYTLPEKTTAATLYVFSLTGRQVFTTALSITANTFQWNLTDSQVRDLPSGPYYYLVRAAIQDRGMTSSAVQRLVIQR